MSRFAYPPGGAGSGYSTIEDNGVAETARTTLDVIGCGFVLTDASSETKLRIGDALTMTYLNDDWINGSTTGGSLSWQTTGLPASVLASEASHPGIVRASAAWGEVEAFEVDALVAIGSRI